MPTLCLVYDAYCPLQLMKGRDTWLISNAICPCTAVSTTLVLNTPVWIAHNGEKEIKYECIT